MIQQDEIHEIVKIVGLNSAISIRVLGGTATPKFDIQTPQGRFVFRVRPPEFAEEKLVRFDHEVLWRLHRAGLPVPCPYMRPDGTNWFVSNNRMWEVLSWVEGEPFDKNNLQEIYNIGQFMARFHLILQEDTPSGKEQSQREDHPDLSAGCLPELLTLCSKHADKKKMELIDNQIDLIKEQLDSKLYAKLPKAIIHGDVHPGNFRFKESHVSAVYDFDYLSLQARARDISDGLMFFAARRASPFNTNDINSLTQPFECDFQRSRIFLDGYQQISRLTELEWAALPWLIRSRWIQMRLRGARKIEKEQKVSFVLDRFFETIDWLDKKSTVFFRDLKIEMK